MTIASNQTHAWTGIILPGTFH